MAATCARAQWLLKSDPAAGRRAVDLADLFCRQARGRVDAKFRELSHNADTRPIGWPGSAAKRASVARAWDGRLSDPQT